MLWSWARRDYYRFTGWSHDAGAIAGDARIVPAGRDGGRALQLTVLPGGNFAIKVASLTLNQDEPRAIEVSAWVRADQLRWFEIMAQDERGEWLPQQDFSGCMGTDEQYRNRLVGAGTHDWEHVRKFLAPRRRVKALTLWVCVRGVDGARMNRNVVGAAWVDDVELREPGTTPADLERRGVSVAPPPAPTPPPDLEVLSIDPGPRLVGPNVMRLLVRNRTTAVKDVPDFTLHSPDGKKHWSLSAGSVPPASNRVVEVSYDVPELCRGTGEQYRLEGLVPITFGTPAAPLGVRVSGAYFYPGEQTEVAVNLNTARLDPAGSCRVVLRGPGGGVERVLLETSNVPDALWRPGAGPTPAMLKDGHAARHNLIALQFDVAAATPVHQWTDPVRDHVIEVTLTDSTGKAIARQTSEPFGFISRPPAPGLPERIERTEVTFAGELRVNGRPFAFSPFPTDKVDLGGVSRMLHFPKTHKILALPFPKDLTFPATDDAAWKEKVQAFVRANKDDPKLFGYFFDHNGETTFWFDKWRDMAACQRKIAAWAREVDANHVICGASWLFGHGALKPEVAEHFDFLDEVDVEPGLRWTPDAAAFRARAKRGVSVVAGLECYYYQPARTVRWRMYEALRLGANDVGICPSGMLAAAPETVSYLRGLYGEMARMRDVIYGQTPADPATCSHPAVTVWERQVGPDRYLIAMCGEGKPPGQVEFKLPAAAKAADVLFEGRRVGVAGGGFTDTFPEPDTVHVYRLE